MASDPGDIWSWSLGMVLVLVLIPEVMRLLLVLVLVVLHVQDMGHHAFGSFLTSTSAVHEAMTLR